MYVSHETIYRSLYTQVLGVLKMVLMQHLRSRRTMHRSKQFNSQPRGQFRDAVPIRERPLEVEERSISRHLEGNLITGRRNPHIATLVERHSYFTLLIKVDGKDTSSLIAGLVREVQKLPDALKGAPIRDLGTALATH
ncbi:IS30 family transposase [Halomonas urmiana]|uniref:IS30 family transposase n=1 Tax=Halomonas urmiana TaxID=490901 RepID=A0A5R8MIG0_9GAMM|nr:IS30 family transposase [Halomonas urmiana]